MDFEQFDEGVERIREYPLFLMREEADFDEELAMDSYCDLLLVIVIAIMESVCVGVKRSLSSSKLHWMGVVVPYEYTIISPVRRLAVASATVQTRRPSNCEW